MPAALVHSLKPCRVFLWQAWWETEISRNGKAHELIHRLLLISAATDRWTVLAPRENIMNFKRNLDASGTEKGRTHPYLPNKEFSSK